MRSCALALQRSKRPDWRRAACHLRVRPKDPPVRGARHRPARRGFLGIRLGCAACSFRYSRHYRRPLKPRGALNLSGQGCRGTPRRCRRRRHRIVPEGTLGFHGCRHRAMGAHHPRGGHQAAVRASAHPTRVRRRCPACRAGKQLQRSVAQQRTERRRATDSDLLQELSVSASERIPLCAVVARWSEGLDDAVSGPWISRRHC